MNPTLRQLRFPKEFRVAPPAWPENIVLAMERLASAMFCLIEKPPEPKPDGGALQKRVLADLGTGLWRLKGRMTDSGTGRPLEEMRRAYRHFESVWDALEAEGIQIYDHTGENFDSGQLLKALAFQPTPGLTRERVIETIRPTIYSKDEMIQVGEVIVGKPES